MAANGVPLCGRRHRLRTGNEAVGLERFGMDFLE
jgi:hypothetical protein